MENINPLDSKGNYSAASNNTKLEVGTLAGDGWAVTFGIVSGLQPRPVPSSMYQM